MKSDPEADDDDSAYDADDAGDNDTFFNGDNSLDPDDIEGKAE